MGCIQAGGEGELRVVAANKYGTGQWSDVVLAETKGRHERKMSITGTATMADWDKELDESANLDKARGEDGDDIFELFSTTASVSGLDGFAIQFATGPTASARCPVQRR